MKNNKGIYSLWRRKYICKICNIFHVPEEHFKKRNNKTLKNLPEGTFLKVRFKSVDRKIYIIF